MPETNPDFSQNNYFALRAGLLVCLDPCDFGKWPRLTQGPQVISEIALLSFILSTGLLAYALVQQLICFLLSSILTGGIWNRSG